MTRAILTCSEYFVEQALNEIRRYQPSVQLIEALSPKHHLIHAPCSFEQLTSPWQNKLSIYLHHLFPIHYQGSIEFPLDDFVRQVQQRFSDFDTVQVRIQGDFQYSAYRFGKQSVLNDVKQNRTHAYYRFWLLMGVVIWVFHRHDTIFRVTKGADSIFRRLCPIALD